MQGSKPTPILRANFRAVPTTLDRKECVACHLLRCKLLKFPCLADSISSASANIFQ